MDGAPAPSRGGGGAGPFPSGYSDRHPYPGLGGRDPAYRWGGYNSPRPSRGWDADGYDRQGYNRRGYNRQGRDRAGYDLFGFDADGFDRDGFDRAGRDAAGQPRQVSLDDLLARYERRGRSRGSLLANPGLARLYGRLAGALSGQERQVVFTREGLGSTDLRTTIYLNPYPLGEDAPPAHNHAVARATLYHEIGHEMITPPAIWQRALDIAASPTPVAGLDAGRALLPHVYNLVEDGRMERRLAAGMGGLRRGARARLPAVPALG